MKKFILIFILAIVLVGITGAGVSFYLYKDFTSKPAQTENKKIIYELHSGKSFMTIADELEKKGVIRNKAFFNLYAKFTNQRSKLRVGEYELETSMTPQQVMSVICSGKSLARPITISEGLNIYEISELIESKGFGKKEDFLSLIRNPELIESLLGPETKTAKIKSLEGYIFPETYLITKYMKLNDIVTQMVHRFLLVWAQIEKQNPQPRLKLTRHQRVTLASIIEKETGAAQERPLISAVFHNRLDKKIRLQTDPTILYGLSEEAGRAIWSITKADILKPTPYNTYVIYGLPPGPVAAPGEKALEAAFNPADTKYLFFVSQNNGTHIFSETYQDHQKAVEKFQMNSKAREGHSWRELSNSNKPSEDPKDK